MERKRKLPARAAARVEHIAKKRTVTPPEHRSVTPVPAPVEEPPPPTLPKTVQPGKPLPTIEEPQPDDLPAREYQSFQESGVLAESLARSRHRWIAEGMFEKYWTKPLRKKGATEDPKNPAKDTMTKIGPVQITIEPHVFEATMWAIKDPKPPAPTTQATFRPILQYGPPNGAMPPPPTPVSTTANPSLAPVDSKPTPPVPTPTPPSPAAQQAQPRPPSSAANEPPKAIPSPRSLGPTQPATATAPPPRALAHPAPASAHGQGPAPLPAPAPGTPSVPAAQPGPANSAPTSRPASATPTPASGAGKPPAAKAQGTDPIIMTLAERASEDPLLRDLMKRVAAGEAKPDELTNFQKIIDQITLEYKRKGGQQGPSADRLLVDGRTVKYFADEVRTIVDIVLNTNPRQKSAELLPPRGSDPLVVALVRAALDDNKIRSMIRRIAENQPGFTDATDLKAVLDKLCKELKGGLTPQPQPSTPQTPVNGVPNGHPPKAAAAPAPAPSPKTTPAPSPATQLQQPPQQALRSKGPPQQPARPEISGVCFDFTGGNGDRYLFPKYSILEYLPGGQQVIASFLIVRKGSQLEYGGDALLDYYQPVTVRIFSPAGRNLDYLQRVVAPLDEVKRYMDDVMDNMTRAEYVLLAMRLPRGERESDKEDNANASGQVSRLQSSAPDASAPKQQSVMWGPRASKFVQKFNKKWFEEWKKKEGGAPAKSDDFFREACEAIGRDPLDKDIEYEKMIELLAAKDSESSS
ncbi:hypothetical protein CkaCkLH20_05720 [Colletotrichum karsti]|uniref:SWR1-complex protein 3 domain-containing protein n=1 Tax=Colletotrichum karsti TaxID=1095194 RepID=A0A9P6I602_9PEZI|nr:uncharacterized protein CkaCkLH20_05720 [Colletotrichum karsti]KAF9876874.1 hypothetical protein CkaCkLH20_05720 [Colletotrichum karsti]